jgi:pilus assembly protein CpaB
MLLAVANRPADNNTTYVTGGDVSRFQRRSVPARTSSQSEEAGDQMTKFATAMGRAITGKDPAAPEGQAVTGPAVRVARGNKVTVVPVGAR